MSDPIFHSTSTPNHAPDQFLVCGLGSLGQHCVQILKKFNVLVRAIELSPNPDWQVLQDPNLLTALHIGDCRQAELLSEAQVERCRAIFLVTNNEQVNLETAFAARLLNPRIRLVVRSAKKNLNQLLGEQLGNFVAFEPTELSAPAFALAALAHNGSHLDQTGKQPSRILGFFTIDNESFHIVKHTTLRGDQWSGRSQLHELNNRLRKVLSYQPQEGKHAFNGFYSWHPATTVEEGHSLITIERSYLIRSVSALKWKNNRRSLFQGLTVILNPKKLWKKIKQFLLKIWDSAESNQIQRVAIICFLIVISLWSIGTILFSIYYPDIDPVDAFYVTAILLLGGFGDIFGEISIPVSLPGWLRLFSFGLTLAGTAFIGVIYALLIEKLLSWRLQFSEPSPSLPDHQHVVVIGLGRVGKRVALLLQELRQPVIGITVSLSDRLPHLPIIEGNFHSSLRKANLPSASSVVAVTQDEMENLEMSLLAHAINPNCSLVIRTYEQRFSDRVAQLFPYAHVLCAAALSAEAFVAAAFGENVVSLFRMDQQTILTTDFKIESDDTLNGLIVAEVAYGYGVVPILHQRAGENTPTFMPSDDLQLRMGDRLFVLATIEGLQRVESGQRRQRTCQIYIEKVLTQEGVFVGANELSRVSGCDLKTAREFMKDVPGKFPVLLYPHQAYRLVERLKSLRILAHPLSLDPESRKHPL